MLKVKNVTKYYGDFKAVDNISFEVKKGEIFGLLGVNGAGKTTTFRMIMNLISPSSGSISFNNKKIDYDVTDKIGFLTEERSLLTKLTVKEQMLYYGALKSLDEKTILERLDKLLKKFEIEDYKDRKINTLSKGNPTIETLSKIADALGVGITDLFEKSSDEVVGAVRIGDNTHVINSKDDIKKLAENL